MTTEPSDPRIGRPELPIGRSIELPGRGVTFVREAPGPSANAPTVVLLHGWTVTAALNWHKVYKPMAEEFRIISLDHRGHGRGIRSHRAFRLEDAADDVAALADVLGIRRFVVAGYSMGGPIAQLIWRRHRQRVQGLVLAATFARSSSSLQERTAMRSLRQLGRACRLTSRRRQVDIFTRAMILGGSQPSGRAPWMVSEVRSGSIPMMMEAGGAIANFDSRPWIGEVDVPTGVFITSRDNVVPPDRQHRMASLLPNARIERAAIGHDGCVTAPSSFVPGFIELTRHAAGQ